MTHRLEKKYDEEFDRLVVKVEKEEDDSLREASNLGPPQTQRHRERVSLHCYGFVLSGLRVTVSIHMSRKEASRSRGLSLKNEWWTGKKGESSLRNRLELAYDIGIRLGSL